MLALVPLLQAQRETTVSELASTFGVSTNQILADLSSLYTCALPGASFGYVIDIDMDAARGEGVVKLSSAELLTRPMRLSPDEALALQVALLVVLESASGELAQAANSALAKLTALAGVRPPVEVDLRSGDEPIRGMLVEAIERGRRIELTYDGATRGETTQPVVDPAQIQVDDGAAYLQAWSLERGAWRSYRLDRIVSVTIRQEASQVHGEVPKLTDGWLEESDAAVVLELAPSAAWVIEYYPHQDVERLPGGVVRATFPVADPRWLGTLLLRLGSAARVVAPQGAGADAVARAVEAIALSATIYS